jgi:quercetin dioxygenase-like cupin family protein
MLAGEVARMSYTEQHYSDADELAPGMYFLRDELDCESLGITVVEADEQWNGKEHDHADEGHEEVYLLMDGSGSLTVDGEDIALEPGKAVRVSPDATRQLSFSGESTMVIAGAP